MDAVCAKAASVLRCRVEALDFLAEPGSGSAFCRVADRATIACKIDGVQHGGSAAHAKEEAEGKAKCGIDGEASHCV